MSNELIKTGVAVAKTPGLQRSAGKGLVITGLGTLGVMGAAALIPFLNVFLTALVALILGGYLLVKD